LEKFKGRTFNLKKLTLEYWVQKFKEVIPFETIAL
jgi:hypothetical protein